MEKVIERLDPLIAEKKASVRLDVPEQMPLIEADPHRLDQAIFNLLENALKYRDAERPEIRVTAEFDAEEARIAVADNGPGIPEHLRARVFEPYFTTKPIGSGTGVGLAVSLGIVEAHGGTLSVDCPPRGGAVFTIMLPVGTFEAALAEVPAAPIAAPAALRSVLIVDDEAEIRETLSEILAAARHRVVTAASGREALAHLEAERYDVVLTDVRMPDIDGRALYEEISRRWPDRAACVVFVTGDTLASAMREFVAQTGRPIIEKPFLPGEVRRIVTELVTDPA
jgi:two-component system NtrC family sensor kinase